MPEKNCNADISKHLFFPITDPNLACHLVHQPESLASCYLPGRLHPSLIVTRSPEHVIQKQCLSYRILHYCLLTNWLSSKPSCLAFSVLLFIGLRSLFFYSFFFVLISLLGCANIILIRDLLLFTRTLR
jgi:hypothetical protein